MLNKTIILGSPRSGTTFIAKLIDSHPEVIYRHEPDIANKNPQIPFHPTQIEAPKYIDITKNYLNILMEAKDLRSAFKIPIFKKEYRNELQRKSIIVIGNTLKVIEKVLRKRLVANFIPDFIEKKYKDKVHYAFKSVDSQCRAYLYSISDPEVKIIYIIRNPCGVIASQLRGAKKGVMGTDIYLESLFKLPEVSQFPFTFDMINNKSPEEQIAFQWMILNEKVINEMANNPHFKLIKYEDLCDKPTLVTKDIFNFMELKWNQQSEHFIEKLENTHNSDSNYFSVAKKPSEMAQKWKKELSEKQIENIKKIVQDSTVGQLYFSKN